MSVHEPVKYPNRVAYARRRKAQMFTQWGDLYGTNFNEREEVFIRRECRRRGVPMGGGRLDSAPGCLDKDALKTFFPRTVRRRVA